MSGFPYIFTFYSFKGGVGRSMALLNTAYTLAGWGKHVLIVDLDLEAPGVSSFLKESKEFAPPAGKRTLDVLTFLGEAISLSEKGLPPEDMAEKLPDLSHYIRKVDPAKLESLTPKLGKLGNLDVLGADLDRDWCRRLSALGLQRLSHESLVEISMALRLYFKSYRFKHRGVGLEDFEPDEVVPYDYILLDSRTGITEVGGLCIGPLADRLVVLSALNEQNIEGTLMVLKEAGIEPHRRSAKSRPWDAVDSPGDPDRLTLGPKPTVVVASPVPNGEIEAKRERLEKLEARLGVKPLRLSYHPQMALRESVFVRDYSDEYLAREYIELANAVTAQVEDHSSQLAGRISRLIQEEGKTADIIPLAVRLAAQDPDSGVSLLLQIARDLSADGDGDYQFERRLHATLALRAEYREMALSGWGNSLSDQAKLKEGAESDRLFATASEKYAAALAIKPDYHEALNNWGIALADQAELKEGAESDRLFAAAGEKYAAALAIKPDKHQTINNWGVALLEQAKLKEGAESDGLFAAAGEKCAAALAIKPDFHPALNNWGVALLGQAKLKGRAEPGRLLAAAGEKFVAALAIKPDSDEALNNWGNVLLEQAKLKEGAESDGLFAAAGEKYAAALAIKPDKHDALNNWGAALLEQAKLKEGAESDGLLTAAGEKYAAALAIKPDKHGTLNNWGTALLKQATLKKGEERNQIFALARDKYTSAEKQKPGSASFNMACLEALQENEAESIRWLKSAMEHSGGVSRKQIAADSDFDPIRELPAFKKYLATLPEE
jgi:Tfp pilus assembly protein PilF/MinD-like ATPase involved in chromosome partitioning or flagellar assembly